MSKTPTALVLLAFLACAGLPAPQSPSEPTAAVVTSAVENMHKLANDSTSVVSQAILGTNAKLLKKERNADGQDWYEVETPDTYRGWISASALRFLKPEEKPYASSGRVFVVSGLLANIYSEASTTRHKPLKVGPISAVLELLGEKDKRWLEIRLPCGTKAWIQRGDGDIREAPWAWPRRSAEEMVALSKRFIGVPYTWGGTSPLGFDCSGFVQLVYKMGGISLLRDANLQYPQIGLIAVPAGEEVAGDLVFFEKGIGHVGMMIDAEYFINATVHETPCVRIDRLKDDFWQRIYQGARHPTEANAK
jgi:cell wall-associated NlpC family hydrolase